MEFRNPVMLENGLVDCEINHPQFGWIPFTCDPHDTGSDFDVAELYARLIQDLTA